MPLSRFDALRAARGHAWTVSARSRDDRAADGGGATFYTVDDIGFAPRDERFFNAQHLNWLGRARFSEAVAHAVVLPRLKRRSRNKNARDDGPGRVLCC